MKQQWAQIALKIDALSLRERGIMLAVLAVAIILLAINKLKIIKGRTVCGIGES